MMTFDEAASVFVLVASAVLLGWRYRPRVFFGRLGATVRHIAGLFVMSRPEEGTRRAPDMDAVYIPVCHTSMDAHTTSAADDITEDGELPRISRTLTDEEFLIFLTVQRKGSGYRLSANEIARIVKGDRNTVLRQIKEIRGGPAEPVYAPYPPQLAHEE